MNVHVFDIPQKPAFVNEKFVYEFFNTECKGYNDLKPLAFSSIALKTDGDVIGPKPDLNTVCICTWDIIKEIFGKLSAKEQDNVDEFQLLMDYCFPRKNEDELSVKALVAQTMMTPFIHMSANGVLHEEFPSYIHYMVKAGMDKYRKQMLVSVHTKFSSVPCFRPHARSTLKEQFENQIYSQSHVTRSVFTGRSVKTTKTRYVLDNIHVVQSTH